LLLGEPRGARRVVLAGRGGQERRAQSLDAGARPPPRADELLLPEDQGPVPVGGRGVREHEVKLPRGPAPVQRSARRLLTARRPCTLRCGRELPAGSPRQRACSPNALPFSGGPPCRAERGSWAVRCNGFMGGRLRTDTEQRSGAGVAR